MTKTWNAQLYADSARYVSEHGKPVVDLLVPQSGERILDLGCGDGELALVLVAAGADVVAVDASEQMVAAARKRGLDARLADARNLSFASEFDAVFSNAALHWVPDAASVVAGVARALRPGGRFVGEFGGKGNVRHVCAALREVLRRRGASIDANCGWYFPDPAEYAAVLENEGFRVRSIELLDRPTEIPGDAAEWLANFADGILSRLPSDERKAAREEANALLEPSLRGSDGVWRIDYVRLRFAADLTENHETLDRMNPPSARA